MDRVNFGFLQSTPVLSNSSGTPTTTTTVVRVILSTLSDPLGKQLSTGIDHNVFRRMRLQWIKIRRDMGGYRIDYKNGIYLFLPKRHIPCYGIYLSGNTQNFHFTTGYHRLTLGAMPKIINPLTEGGKP
jgi:hypothetical protein